MRQTRTEISLFREQVRDWTQDSTFQHMLVFLLPKGISCLQTYFLHMLNMTARQSSLQTSNMITAFLCSNLSFVNGFS
jgi:hypothetical protein